MSYLAERFESAVLTLVGDGTVKQRLANAFCENLEDLDDTDLPDELRASFQDLRVALHQVTPLGAEPCVLATVRKMSAEEADRHATRIFRLYGELVRDGGPQERLSVVNGGDAKLPRFLAEQGR